MCAALFGLMLVCSTTIFPAAAGAASGRREERADDRAAVEEEVEVAGPFDPGLPHAGRERQGLGELGGDRAGRLAQGPGEIEGDGAGEIAERDSRRPLEDDPLDLDAELLARREAHRLRQLRAQGLEHGARVYRGD